MSQQEYSRLRSAAGVLLFGVLSACGGGGSDGGSGPPKSLGGPAGPPTNSERIQAATATAQNNAACTAIQPFYWEIGDASVRLASGSLGMSPPSANTNMLIASASKWMYGAYVAQLRNGQLLDADITALTMRSGYTEFSYAACLRANRTLQDSETVFECFSSLGNDGFDSNLVGQFFYNGGHFQQHAVFNTSLGGNNNAQLRTNIANEIGINFDFTYDSPQLAAGASTSAEEYGFFLREILSNHLFMRGLLGAFAVCTNPTVCPSTAISTPIPTSESWHYSLGHWVEDDATTGDGAFSSPGAFGFYPWIDTTKTYYGIIARQQLPTTIGDSVALDSVNCGRLVRKAWLTGDQQ